jgi:RNA polymerase sigma factor (sigma-70 family)
VRTGANVTPRRLIEPARLAGSTLLRTQSDERLVDLTRDGNDSAFEAIVQRYRRPLMRHCSRLLPEARAEDAVQQAFLSAYTAIRSGDAELNLKPWLYRIAHNAALNALRQNGWTHEQLDESVDGVERPDQAVERRERLGEVVVAVNALPERQRDAIVLRELEGRSYDEIAAKLDVTDGAVRQLLNRARNTLRAGVALLVPPDLAARLAMRGGSGDSIGGRIADICTGAGGAAVAAKLGVAVVAAGVVAGGAVNAPVPGLGGGRGDGSPAVPAVAAASAASSAPGSTRLVAGRGSGSLAGGSQGRIRSEHGAGPHTGARHDGGSRGSETHGGDTSDDRSGDRSGAPADDHSGSDHSGPGGGGSDDAVPVSVTTTAPTTDDRLSSNSGPGSTSSGSGTSGSGTSGSGTSGGGSDDFSTSGVSGSDGR